MEKVKVIFRKDKKDGTIIAFFPESIDGCNIMTYEHIGQHGTASLAYYYTTVKATESEYKALFEEMDAIYKDTCYGTEEPLQLVVMQKLMRR